MPDDKPIVYVTMGSSGSNRDLDAVLDALASVHCSVLAATATGDPAHYARANAFVAKYLPGDAAARRARLVVCNGGSPTSHQALAAGVDVFLTKPYADHELLQHVASAVNSRVERRAAAG